MPPKNQDRELLSTVSAYGKAVLHCLKYPTQPVMGFLIGQRVEGGNVFVSDAVPVIHTHAASAPHPMIQIAFLQVSAVCRPKGLSVIGCYVANERLDDPDVSELTRRLMAYLAAEVGGSNSGTSGSSKNNKDSPSDIKLLLWQFDNCKLLDASRRMGAGLGDGAIKAYSLAASSVAGLAARSHTGSSSSASSSSSVALLFPPVSSNVPEALQLTEFASSKLSFCQWNPTTLKPDAIIAGDSAAGEESSAEIKAVADAVEGRHRQLVDFEAHLDNPQLDYFNEHLFKSA